MVPFRSEALFPTRVLWRRISAANVSGDNSRVFPQFFKRPFEVPNREPAILPIRNRVIDSKTIQIDRDVNIGAAKVGYEVFETAAPVLAQNRTLTLSVFHRAIIGPGMHFEPAATFGAAIRENVVRPPALEISAAPNRDMANVRQLERAIDPAAAAPLWGANVPVRMIIERNKNDRLRQPP